MANSRLSVGTEKGNRVSTILDAAANLFSSRGFHATSVRDIVNEVGMLPGSLYYHFASKEELFYAVYKEGVIRIAEKVREAVGKHETPWERLEAACIVHLEMLLDQSDYARVIVRVIPGEIPQIQDRLAALRAEYEVIFRNLTAPIELPKDVSERYFRLLLLGALNYAQTWYRPRGDSPKVIAQSFIRLLRHCAKKPTKDQNSLRTTTPKVRG